MKLNATVPEELKLKLLWLTVTFNTKGTPASAWIPMIAVFGIGIANFILWPIVMIGCINLILYGHFHLEYTLRTWAGFAMAYATFQQLTKSNK